MNQERNTKDTIGHTRGKSWIKNLNQRGTGRKDRESWINKTAKQKRLWDKEERNHDQKFKANEGVGLRGRNHEFKKQHKRDDGTKKR